MTALAQNDRWTRKAHSFCALLDTLLLLFGASAYMCTYFLPESESR